MRKIESKLRLSFVFQSFQPLIEHPKQYEEALQTTSNSKSFILSIMVGYSPFSFLISLSKSESIFCILLKISYSCSALALASAAEIFLLSGKMW